MRVGYGTITRILPHPKDGYEKIEGFFVYPLNCARVSITFAKVIPPDPLPEQVIHLLRARIPRDVQHELDELYQAFTRRIPPPSGPGPIVSDPAHPYFSNAVARRAGGLRRSGRPGRDRCPARPAWRAPSR